MRTHKQIIADAGGHAALAKALGAETGTAKQWARLDSIPAKYWLAIVDAGLASWAELGTPVAEKANVAPAGRSAAA